MAMTDDTDILERDAALDEQLRRVSYEAGMLLGIDATREEQDYHRRRQTRQQYWLHGAGTVTGMVISIEPDTEADAEKNITVRALVSPGVGIDGLGRELMVHETFCINLGEWLEAQDQTSLLEGYDSGTNKLWLKVSARYRDCPQGKQPVLARKLNAMTDAVVTSRIANSVRLVMDSEIPPTDSDTYRPWPLHPAMSEALPDNLTQAEQDYIGASSGEAQKQLQMQARLLHALDATGVSTQHVLSNLEAYSQILLARISIDVSDIENIIVNPNKIHINNLVRPFVMTAGHVAMLRRQP